MPTPRTDVTWCAIRLNEELYLPKFLENVHGIFSDYVFVDGGSIDGSVRLVKEAGYKVNHIPFQLNFGKQKNNALNLAKTKWRMFMDIDEVMSQGIKELVTNFSGDSFSFHVFAFFRDNFLDGKGQDNYPLDFPVRLFDDNVFYEGAVHEQPNYGNRTLIRYLGGRLFHMKDSFRQYRANLLYELIRRGITVMPPIDEGAFNDGGKLRKVKLLPGRKIQELDEFVEGPLLNV